MTFQFSSILLGGFAAVAAMTLLGATAPQSSSVVPTQLTPVGGPPSIQALSTASPVNIIGIPMPSQMVDVRGTSQLVVPANKIFVLTGIGLQSNVGNKTVTMRVNNQDRLTAVCNDSGGNRVVEVPPGITAPAGSAVTVTINSGTNVGILFGYLGDV